MNPFRSFVELALGLRDELLLRYATENPYTQGEADELGLRLRTLAAACRVAARRMGCAGGETAIDALLQATVDLFNAPAQHRDPYSRANRVAALVPRFSKLADDYDALLREEGKSDKGSARRTGRPRKGESNKERLVISALVKHHRYQPGGSVGNYTPAKTERLAELASGKDIKVSVATVSRFFKRRFPQHDRGYDGYVAACNRDARCSIGMLLALWQGEVPEHLAGLLPHESGCEDDD
jgi:hypothetical protein